MLKNRSHEIVKIVFVLLLYDKKYRENAFFKVRRINQTLRWHLNGFIFLTNSRQSKVCYQWAMKNWKNRFMCLLLFNKKLSSIVIWMSLLPYLDRHLRYCIHFLKLINANFLDSSYCIHFLKVITSIFLRFKLLHSFPYAKCSQLF